MARDEMAVARLAARRRRIVTGVELAQAGMTRSAVRHWVARGRLERVHRGIYLVGPGPLDLEQREIAAVLAYGPGTVLADASAAWRWALRAKPPDEIHIITRTPRRPRDGVRPHHLVLLAEHDVRRHRGLPITTPARTLLDLAAHTATSELERLVGEALGTRAVTRRDLERAVELHPRHRGAAALRTAVQGDPRYTREGAERRLLALIRAAKLPLPQTNVMLHGYEIDMLWPEQRLIVEIDSYWHHAQRPKFERDRVRDAELLAAGYRTLRVTWRALDREPFAAIARLARAHAASVGR